MIQWPPLPKVIQGLAGPIKIDRPMVVDPTDKFCAGQWVDLDRRVMVVSTANREAAWHLLVHELCHSWLDEAGVLVPKCRQEATCQAIASGVLHLIRHLEEEGSPPRAP